MKLHIIVTCERPPNSKGPWPDEQRWHSKITKFKQLDFYADDDDTISTQTFEVNEHNCYRLLTTLLSFSFVTKIEVKVPTKE